MMIFETSPPSSPLLTPHASSDALDPCLLSLPTYKTEEKENMLPKAAQQTTLRGFFTMPPKSKKRPLDLVTDNEIQTPSASTSGSSEPRTAPTKGPTSVRVKEKESLTQMHLTHLPLLHTCQACQMSYVRGGEDETLHERHHSRVVRGAIWDGLGNGSKSRGKGKEKDTGWRVVKDDISFGTKGRGRIIMAEGSYEGVKVSFSYTRRSVRGGGG